MAKATSQGRGGIEEIKGIIAPSLFFVLLFLILYSISSVSKECILFQEKQAKRKVTRADEEKRLAQKKKEEEERRQREIGKYLNPHFFLLYINLEA
jgi:predicted membrane protein